MNIFFLDRNPIRAARYHCDKHVPKMVLESAQIMCTVLHGMGYEVTYRPTHRNHPCTIWAGKSKENFLWLYHLAKHLNEEWQIRFFHSRNHKSFDVIRSLPTPKCTEFKLRGFTYPALAMPDDCKTDDPVESYRNYYRKYKAEMASWSRCPVPDWW